VIEEASEGRICQEGGVICDGGVIRRVESSVRESHEEGGVIRREESSGGRSHRWIHRRFTFIKI